MLSLMKREKPQAYTFLFDTGIFMEKLILCSRIKTNSSEVLLI